MSLPLWKRNPARVAGCLLVMIAACSTTDPPTGPASVDLADGGTDGAAGGAVAGELDKHCADLPAQATSQASCDLKAPDGGLLPEDQPAVRFNASADDDECKYHLSFTTTAVKKDSNFTVTVVATRKADGQPASAADIEVEAVTADKTHVAPDLMPKTTEGPLGTYKIGPLRLDRTGRWIATFHLYEECTEVAKDTPHGHASFHFDVP